MDVFINVPLLFQKINHPLISPDRPVMAGKIDLRLTEEVDDLVDGVAPVQAVPDLGPAQGIDVVQVTGNDFSAAPGLLLRQVKGQLGRRFRIRRILKHKGHPIDGFFLRCPGDQFGGWKDTGGAQGGLFTQAGIHMAPFGPRQTLAVHIKRATIHRDAGHCILTGRFLHESFGSYNADLAGFHLFRRDECRHPGKVVRMTVGDNDRHDRFGRQVLHGKRKGPFGGLF